MKRAGVIAQLDSIIQIGESIKSFSVIAESDPILSGYEI